MDYRSRWYDSGLARFSQPDTIVPHIFRPQSLNRFSYVNNNPIRYKDPSGHCVKASYSSSVVSADECEMGSSVKDHLVVFGIYVSGLADEQMRDLLEAAELTGEKLAHASPAVNSNTQYPLYRSWVDSFTAAQGFIEVIADPNRSNCETVGSVITCGVVSAMVQAFIHEFGHVFDNRYNSLTSDTNAYGEDIGASGWVPSDWEGNSAGYQCDTYPCLQHPASDPTLPGHDLSEEFADMYLNWVLDANPIYPQNGFTYDEMGNARRNWMDNSIIDPNIYPSGIPVFLVRMRGK